VGVTKFPEVMGTNLARQPFTLLQCSRRMTCRMYC